MLVSKPNRLVNAQKDIMEEDPKAKRRKRPDHCEVWQIKANSEAE